MISLRPSFLGSESRRRSSRRPAAPWMHQGMQMMICVEIIGLPNVGKSALFNSLAQKSIAAAANFPFCTIEASTTTVQVPCQYLEQLLALENTIVVTIDFVDVAGIVKGAHRGEGLGNRFLATLRECHALIHLVRTFPNGAEEVVHVNGIVDPVSDATDGVTLC
jgi:ribosome-binding ATPase YchF (GTP1/OBG family)